MQPYRAVERAVSTGEAHASARRPGRPVSAFNRYLAGLGIACEVVAPGLVPARPDERVRTDPCDARKLACLHAGG
jgi:hypothetical protein